MWGRRHLIYWVGSHLAPASLKPLSLPQPAPPRLILFYYLFLFCFYLARHVALGLEEAREAEVGDLDAVVAVEQHVDRLEVAVHHLGEGTEKKSGKRGGGSAEVT